MYYGNECFISDDQFIGVTMLDFWRWGYSNLIHNMHRGTLAEFIVKTSLDSIPECRNANQSIGTGLEPYDVDGPSIGDRLCRIEVKSAAKVQVWDIRHPDRLTFSIAPHRAPDENGEYFDETIPTRNNDLYVFSVYTATDRDANILDLSLWLFYVVPTFEIDQHFGDQKTVSLTRIQEFCSSCGYSDLSQSIIDACQKIKDRQ